MRVSKGAIPVIVMTALLLLWLVFTVQYSFILILDPNPLVKVMGFALIVMPIIGLWWVALELRFVIRGEGLLRTLAAEGALPVDDLPRLASGRIDPEAGRAQFPAYQAEAEADPDSWRAWARLSLAYDAAGDRGRARWAMRRAIKLRAAGRRGSGIAAEA
jgi:hypothetical protein